MSNSLINLHTRTTKHLHDLMDTPERGEIPAWAVVVGGMVALALMVMGIVRAFTTDQLEGLK